MISRVRSAAAAGALIVVGLAGCDSGSPSPPAPPAGPHYDVVDSVCDHVDVTPLRQLLPEVSAEPSDQHLGTIVTCTAYLGVSADEDAQGVLTISLEVYTDADESAEAYEQFYENNMSMSEGTSELAGLGQRAFQAVSPAFDGMLVVRALDGNANLATAWSNPIVQDGLPEESALMQALVEITRDTLASLQ